MKHEALFYLIGYNTINVFRSFCLGVRLSQLYHRFSAANSFTGHFLSAHGGPIFLFQEKGVHRVAVGIGKNIKQEELEKIAGSPDGIVNAASFDELDEQLDNIRETTCSEFLILFYGINAVS